MRYSVLGLQKLAQTDLHGTKIVWKKFAQVLVCWRHKEEIIGRGICWSSGPFGFFKANVELDKPVDEVRKLGWSINALAPEVGKVNNIPVLVAKFFYEISLTPNPSNESAKLVSVSQI